MKKNIIAKTIAFVGICMVISACAQPVKKEIGLQLWSVRDDMKSDAFTTIKKIGDMGYSFIEAAGYNNGQFYGMLPLEFKTLLNNNGIEFLSSHTGKALPDSAEWESTMAWWDTCINAHAVAGVKYIVQPFMDKKGYGSLEDLKKYCDYFNAVGEKCNAKGIRFGYHNHDREFQEVDSIIRYDFMLQNTNPEKVMFQMDVFWIMKGGQNAVDYFNKYPGRFELWHLKDEKELGESGTMDFASLFANRKVSGMKHFIVEVEKYTFEPLVSVQKSYEYLMNADFVSK